MARILHQSDYESRRRRDYPAIGDQLDAIWKGGADFNAMKARVLGVKAKYPKPSPNPDKPGKPEKGPK